MRSARFVAGVLAGAVLVFPSMQAQSRLFTTGTRAELETASRLGLEQLDARARERGIGDELRVSRVHVDRLSMAHTRVQQFVRGVPVFGGEAIVHLQSSGARFAETLNLLEGVSVDTTPRLTTDAAIARATTAYGCSNCLTAPAASDLWILRQDGRDHLVYRVQLQRLDGTAQTALPVVFIDAHDGEVVWHYDNLQTGTGTSLYSGVVSIGTSRNSSAGVYVMEDLSRRIGTFDMRNGVSAVFRFLDGDDVWDSTSQRAGVDAHYGAERFMHYLQTMHGRNGIDGSGGPAWASSHDGSTTLISALVHYGEAYANAFWDPVNGVMVYGDGDGSTFRPLVTLDIAGHEMMHGVTQYTADLIYDGESGALNESWSDVFGAMNERHARGHGANIWLIGEEAYTPGISGDALRYTDDPHRASNRGFTVDDDPDHYSERYTGSLDGGGVHVNSGIANKAFYLLAEGGTHHRGGSMTGIGADAAARIWYTALQSYMTSSTNFAGARVATLNAAAALYGNPSTQHSAVSAAWCLVGVGTCSVPTADSVTPSSGSGSGQTFVLRYSDTAGATILTTAWVWFTPALASSAASSCLVHYDRATASLNLLNDAGTTWLRGTPGTSGMLQNSQCAIGLSGTSIGLSGSTLTLTLPTTFRPSFNGAKSIFMYASNTGANSGWQLRGTWTVNADLATVTADSATPDAGSGLTQQFALRYSDNLGATDITTAWAWFNATFASSAAASCLLHYERPTHTLRLLNDAGTTWLGAAVGSGGTLQNSQCAVAMSTTTAVPSGTTLTLTLGLTFKAPFSGAKNIFMYAANSIGSTSGWQTRGTWTVPAPASAVVTADSATPNTGSGASQMFALQYGDTLGATDFAKVWVWFNATFASSAAASCLLYYEPPTNTLRLLNDAGTEWMPATLGGSGALQNSQCAVDLGTSTAVPSGTTLTLTLAVTFKPSFSGAKSIFMYAASATGPVSGWQTPGTWTVPGVTVTADAAAPDSGSGTAQTFALQYADTFGATDLATVWVWFNATFASSSAGSCLVYYEQSTSTLRLINDTGTGWLAALLGSGGTLQNSQCAIAVAAASATPTGNTLTLTLPVTFSGTFGGAKTIFMYAASAGGATSAWQTRGSWTVP